MIINISSYKDKFIDIPSNLFEDPIVSSAYINNIYYMFGSYFKSFSKEEICELYTPSHFFSDDNDNLYFYMSFKESNFKRIFFKLDEQNKVDIDKLSSLFKTEKNEFPIPAIVYCFNTQKILITINNSDGKWNDSICDVFGDKYMQYSVFTKVFNYNWMIDWYEFLPEVTEILNNTIDIFNSTKFFIVHDYVEQHRKSKYDRSLIDMIVSCKIVGGLKIVYKYKIFDASSNTMFKLALHNEDRYNKEEYIFFDTLLKDKNYIKPITEDFVKECVVYHRKSKLREELHVVNHDIKEQIRRKQDEINKLKEMLNSNEPVIDKINKDLKELKSKNIELNFSEFDNIRMIN